MVELRRLKLPVGVSTLLLAATLIVRADSQKTAADYAADPAAMVEAYRHVEVASVSDAMEQLLLIAEGKAVPMIMPSGWTPLGGQVMTSDATKDPFNDELMKDILRYMHSHFRVKASAENRALSGLSMGGIQTLNIGLENLGSFRYLAVMSSGWTTDKDRDSFFSSQASRFPSYNSELKPFWWGWGQTDIARANSLLVTDRFKSLGVHMETTEKADCHEWKNWRLYLYEVAPKLFR